MQWTGGTEEAILRVALKEGAKVDLEALKERLGTMLAQQLPGNARLLVTAVAGVAVARSEARSTQARWA